MFGLVCYRDENAKTPPVRVIGGVRFRAVYLPRGGGLAARLSCRAAVRALLRDGADRAVFLTDETERAYFERRGVSAVSVVPLHRASAAAIARRALAQRGVEPQCATLAFAAERMTPELRRAVLELAPEVRHMTLAVRGGETLARELRAMFGIAVRVAAPGEAPCADLTLCFDPCDVGGAMLPLFDPALAVEYDGEPPSVLLAALWQAGALDTGTLGVKSVKIPDN